MTFPHQARPHETDASRALSGADRGGVKREVARAQGESRAGAAESGDPLIARAPMPDDGTHDPENRPPAAREIHPPGGHRTAPPGEPGRERGGASTRPAEFA
jgi:hypothetical protein